MKKILFGIFAHPDDEAFGPSGYLIQNVRHGAELHIICMTDGSASGQGSAQIRANELQHSAEIIGAKSVAQHEFFDGELNNNSYDSVVKRICETILSNLPNSNEPCELSFVTFEPNGITGHLDHIAVSLATTFVYTHPKIWLPDNYRLAELRYFCLCDAQKAEDLDYFIYSPKGHPEEEIHETIDVSDVLDIKKRAIAAHASQEDFRRILEMSDHLLANEHFMLYKS